jgi:hypothetical protein
MTTMTLLLAPLALCAGMLLMMEVGWRLGRRAAARDAEGFERRREACRAVDAAVFALFGLLIAFTFGRSAGRFNERRDLILEEVNCVGTAWTVLDLLPAAAQEPAREAMRRYLDARFAVYAALPDYDAARAAVAVVDERAEKLWHIARGAYGDKEPHMSLVNDLTDMFSIGSKRTMAMEVHMPTSIVLLLFLLSLGAALLVGLDMARAPRRSPVQLLAFAVAISMTVWVILDIEYPRFGLIRIDAHDQPLHELRARMG